MNKEIRLNIMKNITIIFISILTFPISLTYWFAWAMIEAIREDDGTVWTKNPLNFNQK